MLKINLNFQHYSYHNQIFAGCKTKPPRPDSGVLILNEHVPDINGSYAIGSAIAFGCDYDEYVIGPSFSKCFGIEWFPNVDHIDCIIGTSCCEL